MARVVFLCMLATQHLTINITQDNSTIPVESVVTDAAFKDATHLTVLQALLREELLEAQGMSRRRKMLLKERSRNLNDQ